VREFGTENAKKIKLRMAVLVAANCLEDVPTHVPERRHQLTGNREGQFAVDLKHPFRLVFEPNHNPLPLGRDGGLDLRRVSAVSILEIEDYHG
jgi:proteic killer suppression protein